jgi:hypothetical protein
VHEDAHVVLVDESRARAAEPPCPLPARPAQAGGNEPAIGKPASGAERLDNARQPIQAVQTDGSLERPRQKLATEEALRGENRRPNAVGGGDETLEQAHINR